METKEKLKRILMEWKETSLPSIYPRDFRDTLLRADEILSIIGARRSGKTFLCYQLIKKLSETVPPDNILYLNLEDERLDPIKGDELTLLWETYLELFSPDLSQRVYLFVDEVQNVPNWSKWARRMTDQQKKLKLILTGSSAKLLSREIATELRGRTLSFTIYPMSFREYLRVQGVTWDAPDFKKLLYSPSRITFKKHFNAYQKGSGFPATLAHPVPHELLKEYYRVMFYRDLVERYKIKNIRLLEDCLTLMMDQVGNLFSISQTAKKLESFGHSLSKNTLSRFSQYTQDMFMFFEVKKYNFKIKEQLRAARKIYTIDHGLARAIRFSFSEEAGRLMENTAFLGLRRRHEKIFYHARERACDFLVQEHQKIVQAIQVTKSLGNIETKKREVDGLMEALIDHGLGEGYILTEDEQDTIMVGRKRVHVLPLWYWLLSVD